ncbi:MAG TPA: peptidoglycan-associated lipoprotein Pal [Smithella sp.]|nr:peptidoglycan-associated lipoprotein Pal [Smithella sp.]MDM7986574.1 peptidoglycan-associated lipoprotein Pal [Smithella sp.]HNY49153.1 peptidoglycan-associated lipoprotein Pal [Smithella sp.]HOG90029.1 peptidoglycan-associated lipoprotein Pal [Smithella sp.]HOU49599.1 peptidoglycan-associated lipoprotein Pal [Smithella sp.]
MKNCIMYKGMIVVLILSLLAFAGCASKKSVVTSDTGRDQGITSDTARQDALRDQAREDAEREALNQSVDLEKMSQIKSPVSDINFDFDSSSIRPDARIILERNADYFMKNRVSSIVIEGHCDEQGTAEYNMALGERRAQETKKYLVNLGVKESLMKTVSFGEENPLDPASDEEAWAKNRRAHFVVNP